MGDVRPAAAARPERGRPVSAIARRGRTVQPRQTRQPRLTVAILAILAIGLAAGCTVGGSAVIAPYRSVPLSTLSARVIVAPVAGVLALAPNGYAVAVADPLHGICIHAVPTGPATFCAKVALSGRSPISAVFSPDGETIALGQNVTPQGGGRVWLVDARTGDARQVPAVDAPAAVGESAATGSSYVSMLWNSGTGHLLLVSNSTNATGARSRLVDVDPGSLIPRVVVTATGPYEFQTGNIAGAGPSVIFTVTRSDQIPPNLVEVDLGTGARKETGPLGANGTQLVPLAVSPDGAGAIVGSATYGDTGPPQRLDLRTGTLAEIPGLTGNFALAAYSPNGTQIAVVSTTATSIVVQVADVAGGPARTVGTIPGALTDHSRMTWSGLDALSISTPTALAAGAVVGWTLRN